MSLLESQNALPIHLERPSLPKVKSLTMAVLLGNLISNFKKEFMAQKVFIQRIGKSRIIFDETAIEYIKELKEKAKQNKNTAKVKKKPSR